MSNVRLSTQFHEKFSLTRQAIYQIVKTIDANPNVSKLKKTELQKLFVEQTSLGPNYIKSMPQYAKGSGILNFDNTLSSLGKCTALYDPLYEQLGTQWLMHYHLSAPYGPGPTFWNNLVSKLFFVRNIFSGDDVIEQIGDFIWQTENKILALKGVKSTSNIFLGTYTKPEALGKLRLLELLGSGHYRVCEPNKAPVWAVGYALIDFWEAFYAGRVGIGLDTLQESDFPKLFMMGKSELDDVLQALQEIRYVEVHKTAPPHQVLLLRQDSDLLLKKLYGAD